MSAIRCELCNKEVASVFIVSHKERGRVRICKNCLEKESKSLLAQKGCCCC